MGGWMGGWIRVWVGGWVDGSGYGWVGVRDSPAADYHQERKGTEGNVTLVSRWMEGWMGRVDGWMDQGMCGWVSVIAQQLITTRNAKAQKVMLQESVDGWVNEWMDG